METPPGTTSGHLQLPLMNLENGNSGSVCIYSSSVSKVGMSPPLFVGDDYFYDAGSSALSINNS